MDVVGGFFADTSMWFNADGYTSLIKTMSTEQIMEEEKRITASIDRRTYRENAYNKLAFLTVGASMIGSSIVAERIRIARKKLEIIQVDIKRRGLAEHGETAAADDIQTTAQPFETPAVHIHTTNGLAETVAERFVGVNFSKTDKMSWTGGTQPEGKGIESVEEQQSEGINKVEITHGEQLNYTEEKQEEGVEGGGRQGREFVQVVVKGAAKLLASDMGETSLQPVGEALLQPLGEALLQPVAEGVAEGVASALLEIAMAVISV